jgi:hypothetical protein
MKQAVELAIEERNAAGESVALVYRHKQRTTDRTRRPAKKWPGDSVRKLISSA